MKLLRLFITVYFMTIASWASADLAVVVNKDHPLDAITIDEAAAIFMGQTKQLKGHPLTPIDQAAKKKTKNRFYLKVSKKTPIQMKAYWSRLLFSGRGSPPLSLESTEDLKSIVSEEIDYISYLDTKDLDGSVKVILVIAE